MPLLTGSFRDVTAIRAHIPDAVFIAVTRAPPPRGIEGLIWVPELGPSRKLLKDFLRKKAQYSHFLTPEEAHKRAWEDVSYEERYVMELRNSRRAREWMARIRRMVLDGKTVVLLCYCPQKLRPYCHRFVLQELIMGGPAVRKYGAVVGLDEFMR